MNHKQRLRRALTLALGLWLAVACAPAAANPAAPGEPQPPAIAYGVDVCAASGLTIADPAYAAATLTVAGNTLKFEDVGAMLHYHMGHPTEQVAVWFAHDYGTHEWVRGDRAYYVMGAHGHTPGAHGIVAFSERAVASGYADALGASVLTFDELRLAAHAEHHGH